MSNKSVRVRITGRVQGVWYRAWTCEQALSRNLDGWVRNMHDGSVEAVFSGPEAGVDDMVRVCHDGPKLASVDALNVEQETGAINPGFHSRSTG